MALMATKDEIKSLVEAEIGPLKAKLTLIEKSFSELDKSVKHFSAKYDELLKQVQCSNDRTAKLKTFLNTCTRLLGADRHFTNRRSILF